MFITQFEKSIRMYNHKVTDQFKEAVHRKSEEAFTAGDNKRDGILNPEMLMEYKKKLKADVIACIGGLPEEKCDLNARITGTIAGDGYRIEKVIFESRPKVYVTCNLYIPDGAVENNPAVLFVCGHGKEAKQYPSYRSVCRHLARSGFIVLAQDPLGQGERLGYYESSIDSETIRWGTTEHEYDGNRGLLTGNALAKYFLHDSMRSIDYLCQRPEVDNSRIGITGNSGGGVQSALMMICDDRLAAAAPATYITGRREYLYRGETQDAEQIWPGFTDLGYDHEDILIGMAPKPVRVLSVKWDFFPIEGTRKTYSRSRRFWEMFGKEDDFDMVEDFSTHKYTPVLGRAAADFFTGHFGIAAPKIDDYGQDDISVQDLNCTLSGQVRTDFPDARFVWHELNDELDGLSACSKEDAVWWLKDKIFKDQENSDLNPRFNRRELVEEFIVNTAFWWSAKGIFNHGCLFRHFSYEGETLPLTIALWKGGSTVLSSNKKFIREICLKKRAVLVLDITADGRFEKDIEASDDDNRESHKLKDDLIWLNESLVARRTFDVIKSLDMAQCLSDIELEDIHVYSKDDFGIYSLLAALLDNRIKSVLLKDCPESLSAMIRDRYYDFDFKTIHDKILPGILKHMDLPVVKDWIENEGRKVVVL